MKKKIKIMSVIVSMMLSLFYLTGCEDPFFENDLEKLDYYKSKIQQAETFIPSLNDLNDFENVSVYCYYDPCGGLKGFLISSINLIVEYNEEIYQQEKSRIESKYQFMQVEQIPIAKGYKSHLTLLSLK